MKNFIYIILFFYLAVALKTVTGYDCSGIYRNINYPLRGYNIRKGLFGVIRLSCHITFYPKKLEVDFEGYHQNYGGSPFKIVFHDIVYVITFLRDRFPVIPKIATDW